MAAAVAVLAVGACHEPLDDAPSGAQSAETSPTIRRGAKVVVERTAGEFLEATVLTEQKEHLRLQTVNGAESLRVSRTDVYPLSQRHLASGATAYAICELGRLSWSACRVTSRVGNQANVVTPEGKEFSITREQVLQATALTRMNIEDLFARAKRRQQFQQDLTRARDPRAPVGWRVSANERVVAKRQGDWFTARVVEIEDDGVRVRFKGHSVLEKIDMDHVIPEPPYRVALKRGDFALLRPRAAAEAWVYVRVRVSTDDLKVEDVNGHVTQVNYTSLIPLVAP